MALVMGITLPAGWDIIYNKTLKMYDISVVCNVGKNPRWFPRQNKRRLKEITYFFDIANVWEGLSQEIKDNWATAGAIIGQYGWNLFVQDKSYRIKNSIEGNATPSIHHQYLVGHINIDSPANLAKIVQYNFDKIVFPSSLKISSKTDLVADGPDPFARVNFIYTRYKDGITIDDTQTIEIPLSEVWGTDTLNIVQNSGSLGRWKVEIELNDVVGDIWFDNVLMEYGGQIRVNDPYCSDVVKWWRGLDLGAGVTFETIYPTGGAL